MTTTASAAPVVSFDVTMRALTALNGYMTHTDHCAVWTEQPGPDHDFCICHLGTHKSNARAAIDRLATTYEANGDTAPLKDSVEKALAELSPHILHMDNCTLFTGHSLRPLTERCSCGLSGALRTARLGIDAVYTG